MASTDRKLSASELDELERTLVECAAEHYFAEAFEHPFSTGFAPSGWPRSARQMRSRQP